MPEPGVWVCESCQAPLPTPLGEAGTPCRYCGSKRRQYQQHLAGELPTSGVLIAHKPRPAALQVNVAEEIRATEGLVGIGVGADQESIRVADSSGLSSAVDAIGETVKVLSFGRAPRQEDGTPEVCATLCEALQATSPGWRLVTDHALHEADDGLAELDGRDFAIQVTRVGSEDAWQELGRNRKFAAEMSPGRRIAVDWLRRAIEKKLIIPGPQRPTTILALSARDFAFPTFESFVVTFRRAHGAWAGSLGFHSVWVVGPIARLTWRLDT